MDFSCHRSIYQSLADCVAIPPCHVLIPLWVRQCHIPVHLCWRLSVRCRRASCAFQNILFLDSPATLTCTNMASRYRSPPPPIGYEFFKQLACTYCPYCSTNILSRWKNIHQQFIRKGQISADGALINACNGHKQFLFRIVAFAAL